MLVDGNPAFVYWIGSWFKRYGPERERWAYPGKSYFDYSVVVAATSDAPVTPLSPWWGLFAAIERKEINTSQVIAPEERLSVLQALELFTRNPAYIAFGEQKGSLDPGKLADFIVIDRDVLAIPAEQIKECFRYCRPGSAASSFMRNVEAIYTVVSREPRPIQSPETGPIVCIPEVGGLHHRHERQAA